MLHESLTPTPTPTPTALTIVVGAAADLHLLSEFHRVGATVVASLAAIERAGLVAAIGGGRIIVTTPDTVCRTSGCPCCAVRLDLVDAVRRAVVRAVRPTHLVIAVELDDAIDARPGIDVVPSTVYTVVADAEIARLTALDAVIAVADSTAIATRLATGQAVGRAAELQAWALADRIVLNRWSDLDETMGNLVAAGMSAVSPIGDRVTCSSERSDVRSLLDLDAWHGAPPLRSWLTQVQPDLDGFPHAVALRQNVPLDADAIEDWLDRLVRTHARRLLRMQGVFAVAGSDVRICCHGVRSFAMSHSEDQHRAGRRHAESVVIVIGDSIDIDDLAQTFRNTRAR